jgi:very-short-patch-repair endonuclease
VTGWAKQLALEAQLSNKQRETSLARHLRKNATVAERKASARARSVIVDFYCPELRIVIELDGGVHGYNPRKASDGERTRFPEIKGCRCRAFGTGFLQRIRYLL